MSRETTAPVPIGKYRVDIDALLRLRHHCDPDLCRHTVSCCRCYEVCITRKEMGRAIGLMKHAAKYARRLRKPGFENPFDPVEPGLYAIDTHEDESCVFAYRRRTGETFCSLHSAALDLGLDPYAVKPQPCTLWPLALSEDDPPVLSVQSHIRRFPCIVIRPRPARNLDPAIADTIRTLFGEAFLEELNAAIATRRSP